MRREVYLRRIAWTGALSTLAFSLLIHISLLWDAPTLNMALWDGGFLTINMAWATFWGLGLELVIGGLLTYLFDHYWAPVIRGPGWFKGASFGVAWWGFMMLLGFPMLGLLSPLSRYGILPAPGFFALGEGAATPFLFLLAMVGFGVVAGFLLGDRRIVGPFRWRLS